MKRRPDGNASPLGPAARSARSGHNTGTVRSHELRPDMAGWPLTPPACAAPACRDSRSTRAKKENGLDPRFPPHLCRPGTGQEGDSFPLVFAENGPVISKGKDGHTHSSRKQEPRTHSSRFRSALGEPAHIEGTGVAALLVLRLATFSALAAHIARAPAVTELNRSERRWANGSKYMNSWPIRACAVCVRGTCKNATCVTVRDRGACEHGYPRALRSGVFGSIRERRWSALSSCFQPAHRKLLGTVYTHRSARGREGRCSSCTRRRSEEHDMRARRCRGRQEVCTRHARRCGPINRSDEEQRCIFFVRKWPSPLRPRDGAT